MRYVRPLGHLIITHFDMKKILIILGLFALFACEEQDEQCWMCEMTKYRRIDDPVNPYVIEDMGADIYCGFKPKDFDLYGDKYEFICKEIY